MTNTDKLAEALRECRDELMGVLDSLNAERMHHDGDVFHERLLKANAALAAHEAAAKESDKQADVWPLIEAYGRCVADCVSNPSSVLSAKYLRLCESNLRDALAAHEAAARATAPETGDTNGRHDGLRPDLHGRVPLGGHTPGALADLLWASDDVMALNAELGLTMDRLVQFAQAVLAAEKAEPAGEAVPVAWYLPAEGADDSMFRDHRTVMACTGNPWTGWIPLYTHPPAAPAAEPTSYEASMRANSYRADLFCPDVVVVNLETAVSILRCAAPTAPAAEPLTKSEIYDIFKKAWGSDNWVEASVLGAQRACAEKWGVKLGASGGEVQR